MQFKHPEILYALFLLLIPIIVHLFQLRRFQKVPFTNVKFLKRVEKNTRKSSKLKKFLILCTRLLALAALVFAFAQPFYSKQKKNIAKQTYIYLDNSFSMQAKGNKGELLKRAVQDILENYQKGENVNLITNDKFLKNLTQEDLKRALLTLDYHPLKQDLNTTLFRIKNNASKNKNTLNEVVLLSDFQNIDSIKIDSLNSYHFVTLSPVKTSNISLDSVYISDQNNENILIKTIVKDYNNSKNDVTVSLYDNTILQGKSNVSFRDNTTQTVEFSIPANKTFNGRLTIDDTELSFDNELFFTINKEDKINVAAIGNDNAFLNKIYTNDEFNFVSYKPNQVDYSKLNNQNLIVLNEVENISGSLTNSLSSYVNNGGSLVIIPSLKVQNYNTLFSNLAVGGIGEKITGELAVTDIKFNHPILKNVFERQIKNFQYPNVKSYYKLNLRNSSAILNFENETPFVSQINSLGGAMYVFASAIGKENSNFKNSPLIVPVFYNFGKLSYKHSALNYTIGNQNEIEVKAQLDKDDILQVTNNETDFIPLQQIGNTSVMLSLNEQPLKSGIYQLKNKEENIKNLAFNYNREESDLTYGDISALAEENNNVSIYTNVKDAFTEINNEYKTNSLWQYFLIATAIFLLIEILLLKFLKP